MHTPQQLAACFPVISQLRPNLNDAVDWAARALHMKADGYRVLAACEGDGVVAVAGYRVMESLLHGRFVYVDDLVTASECRGRGIGALLLQKLSEIGEEELCARIVLDTAATNTDARRFCRREGMSDVIVGFVKPLKRFYENSAH